MRRRVRDFKAFLMRGRIVDLAVGIVVGVAFAELVKSLVGNIVTPIFAIPGSADFADLAVSISGSELRYGAFLNDLISFLMIALAVYLFVVRPLGAMQRREAEQGGPDSPEVKTCPHCLSTIPRAARRCAFCTGEQEQRSEAVA